MIFRSAKASDPLASEITPHSVYLNRRQFMGQTAALALAAAASDASALVARDKPADMGPQWLREQIAAAKSAPAGDDAPAPYSSITNYNNFYEFGYDKDDPARYAGKMKADPWSVRIEGECEVKGTYALEDLLKGIDLEERIYRLRCVEAWSMVIPWIGFSLSDLIKRCKPLSSAKYVEFISLADKDQMPGVRSAFSTIDWPYREGLRMDEAMHPLTMLAVGLYGEVLPNQNGAPIRLVVPWKYGFKSAKSIVAIRFSEQMPKTTWSQIAPQEYGFYANVNPAVDHPRWSQASERRLPSGLFSPNRIDTRLFNGYDEVASLYSGMDVRRFY
ncbi:protein-methionine-sulfoxide reductase catalytic subunit MsrP [Thalassolituus sp. LLYu03]|uniref:protein-methionine-sulfoxide reductase catalytic subunit MsrP n=1 Tax=Thalassolituus sp. LLYu03 TaxID=3421656 RepID=UPI003D2ACEB1